MRTTLTLDDDVARMIDDAVHRERRPMKQVVNDALRKGLSTGEAGARPYRLVPHETEVLAGLDSLGFNRLADELDDARVRARMTGGS